MRERFKHALAYDAEIDAVLGDEVLLTSLALASTEIGAVVSPLKLSVKVPKSAAHSINWISLFCDPVSGSSPVWHVRMLQS